MHHQWMHENNVACLSCQLDKLLAAFDFFEMRPASFLLIAVRWDELQVPGFDTFWMGREVLSEEF
jgi:hypothetical protein